MTTSTTVLDTPARSRAPRLRVRARLWALLRGRQDDALWVRPALLALLAATALLLLWDLGASGWANSFYAAAVQAGSKSWKAFFFGSFDSSNFITVDKPPVALWVMDVSVRLFGLNSWSMLVPEALAGVATVGLVYATVRRWSTPAAGLISGAIVALTPVAAMMFRFDNPDAVLVLLVTAAIYASARAIEEGGSRWLVLAGVLLGTGFLTKMMQAFLVVPVLAAVFLLAAPSPLRTRLRALALAAVALVVASGWWVAIVQLIPAADRPYIGGSQDNSLLNLIFGYNGFGRIDGNETGSVGGNGAAGSMWGPTGWDRLFLTDFGGQISWLIPAALILLVAGLWLTRRAPRTDRTRAALLLWGGSLLVTGAVFSYATGIIHPYYTIALAPPIAATIGIGATLVWRHRSRLGARLALAAALVATVVWSDVLLDRSPDWYPWLRVAILVTGLATALGIVWGARGRGPATAALAVAALAVGLAGPFASTVDTVLTPHDGAIPSAGPVLAGAMGGPGGGPGGGAPRGGFGGGPGGAGGGVPGGQGGGQGAGFGGGPGGGSTGSAVPAFAGGPPTGLGGGQGGGAAAGGLLNSSTPGSALVRLLDGDASSYRWVAAAVGANSAAGYQLATDHAVMAIGGFNGTDPTPTLAAFETMVADHEVHYFLGGGMGGPGGPGGGTSSTSSQISSWVQSHFTAKTVDGVTVYDLTSPASSAS